MSTHSITIYDARQDLVIVRELTSEELEQMKSDIENRYVLNEIE